MNEKNPKVVDESKIIEIKTPKELTAEAMYREFLRKQGKISPLNKAKGGSVKKKKKFPDLSGDGKVTKKDILMAKGIIKKKPKKKR